MYLEQEGKIKPLIISKIVAWHVTVNCITYRIKINRRLIDDFSGVKYDFLPGSQTSVQAWYEDE